MAKLQLSALVWPVFLSLFGLTAALTWRSAAPASLLTRPDEQERVLGESYPKILVDAYGHHVRLGHPPGRIISGMLAADEILLDLLSREKILAVTSYATDPEHSNCVEKAKGLLQISNLPLEKVLALQPDLVLAARFSSGQVIAQMRQCDVPVFCFGRYDSLQDVRHNVALLGAAVGAETRAQEIIAWMDRVLAEVRHKTAAAKQKPRVLYYHLRATQGKNTIFDELLEVAGGTNAAAEAGVVGYKSLSAELIPALNPEVVIVPQVFSGAPETWAASQPVLLEDPVWQSVQAMRQGRIHGLPRQHLDSISHHVVKAAVELAAVLHPDLVRADIPPLPPPSFSQEK